jgi:hypothetical protein
MRPQENIENAGIPYSSCQTTRRLTPSSESGGYPIIGCFCLILELDKSSVLISAHFRVQIVAGVSRKASTVSLFDLWICRGKSALLVSDPERRLH